MRYYPLGTLQMRKILRQIPYNHPYIVCMDYLTSKSYLINVAIPGDSRIKENFSQKHQR